MKIYFSGIGGVGVGPLAEIAHDAGYQVIGSDLEESLMTEQLRRKNITINIGQNGTFLRQCHLESPIDWFIHTSALPKDHPELLAARKLGIKTAKRDELLAHIIKEKNLKLIAVAGTHGKTTTTGMLIWVFKQLGIPVSYSIGTTISFGSSGEFDSDSQYFIYECDEFDRNFLHFYPYLSLITSLDYDHPDTYPSKHDYFDAFRQFASQSRRTIIWRDQQSDIFEKINEIDILDPQQINPDLRLAGIHNRRNATLSIKAIEKLGINQNINDILSDFPGTDRRFEKLAPNLYSDYGHHPIEIAATLQMARELSDNVVLVYQPHQNIRQHHIRDEYTDQFELAEKIYWLPTYLSREDPNLRILSPEELIQNLTNKNAVSIADFNDDLWNEIVKHLDNSQLVLCMGAGRIDSWVRQRLISNRKPE
ncbi:hypothetical protein HGB24_01245 [Candidatus Saccharibacteria bacterium]|nr:hypothetical protein [Candidatus Saccharibacteria bacterium]